MVTATGHRPFELVFWTVRLHAGDDHSWLKFHAVVACPYCRTEAQTSTPGYELVPARVETWEKASREECVSHFALALSRESFVCQHCGTQYGIPARIEEDLREAVPDVLSKDRVVQAVERLGLRTGVGKGRTPRGGRAGGEHFTYRNYVGSGSTAVASSDGD